MFKLTPTNLSDFKSILFATAYKMIGEVHASEDIVQETLLVLLQKLAKNELTSINNAKSYLVKIVINRALNYLKKVKRERDNYHGVWLPEPVFNNEENIDYQMDISFGLTFLLSRLNPKERAVFILKNAFDFSFKEIGEAIQLKEATCRKTFQRLQVKLKRKPIATKIEKEEKERLLTAFLAVGETGDLASFISILREDMTIYSDGGGKIAAAKIPLEGLDTCLKFLLGIYEKTKGSLVGEPTLINGEPAILLKNIEGELETVMLLDIVDGKISAFYFIRNPDKLNTCYNLTSKPYSF